jgi:glycerol-3-phosphate cytidylyltransferase
MNNVESKKYKIGYTSGVFDMFHIGHLNILSEAKALCDYLVVGVSTDELVKMYKGKQPIISFDQRCSIVAAIKYVDKVISQTTMDKMDIWEEIHFDVLFHGDDWKDSVLYREYQEKLSENGIDLVFIKHTDGISSSLIAQRLKENYILNKAT